MARGPKLAEIIAISSQWTFLGELLVRASGSTTGRKRAWVMDMVTPQGGGGWEGVDAPGTCVCVVHNFHVQQCIAGCAHPSTVVQAHPSQEFLREDRVLVPGGAITPLWRLGAPWKRD